MQPHQPLLGKTAEKIRKMANVRGWDKYHKVEGRSSNLSGNLIWKPVKEGNIPNSVLKKAYAESLEIVLGEVERLINNLNGKTIISSDHGELLGERVWPNLKRRYGHPHDVEVPETCIVPWFAVEGKGTRNIVAEEPIGFERLTENMEQKRLEALGYL